MAACRITKSHKAATVRHVVVQSCFIGQQKTVPGPQAVFQRQYHPVVGRFAELSVRTRIVAPNNGDCARCRVFAIRQIHLGEGECSSDCIGRRAKCGRRRRRNRGLGRDLGADNLVHDNAGGFAGNLCVSGNTKHAGTSCRA